jgi:hypothetical protein
MKTKAPPCWTTRDSAAATYFGCAGARVGASFDGVDD